MGFALAPLSLFLSLCTFLAEQIQNKMRCVSSRPCANCPFCPLGWPRFVTERAQQCAKTDRQQWRKPVAPPRDRRGHRRRKLWAEKCGKKHSATMSPRLRNLRQKQEGRHWNFHWSRAQLGKKMSGGRKSRLLHLCSIAATEKGGGCRKKAETGGKSGSIRGPTSTTTEVKIFTWCREMRHNALATGGVTNAWRRRIRADFGRLAGFGRTTRTDGLTLAHCTALTRGPRTNGELLVLGRAHALRVAIGGRLRRIAVRIDR
jgi:hypothetical protein